MLPARTPSAAVKENLLPRSMKIPRLAIISTHPIQYYAPIFQALVRSGKLCVRVFYTWSQTASAEVADSGFGRTIRWDIPLLEGYEFEFVPNVARRPGTDHFFGLRNPSLNRAVESWQPDAVLVFGWNSEAHLRALLHFKQRIPVFFRGDSTLLNRRPGWRTLARKLYLNWVYRHVDVAIAVGANNRDYYEWCGLAPEQIAFAPHAIDTERFADPQGQHEGTAQQWRAQLGIAPQARVVLFAGKLQVQKDPFLLLAAFLTCEAAGHLVFVGHGALESELRARAAGHSNVHFLPFQNQLAMPAVYRLGDVFILPSCSETWGLALNEAMACGRALIASDRAGGTRDLVKEGINGWAFRSGDLVGLTSVIRRALTCQESQLRSMGEAARQESSRWSIREAALGIERAVMCYVFDSSRAPLPSA